MTAPTLLYISPVIPNVTGNGLAMRASAVLEALSAQHRVSLLVVPLYAPYGVPIPDSVGRLCARSAILSPPLHGAPVTDASLWTVIRQLVGGRRAVPGPRLPFADAEFSAIHVFRLAALPYAQPYLERSPDAALHLDLDDIESVTHRRLAGLYRHNGLEERARAEEGVAERSRVAEDEAFAQVDRLYVCSESDAGLLTARTGTQIVVLPNAVRPPPPVGPPPLERPFGLLFVGNLGYYPNEDAVHYFWEEILPALRRCAPRDFTMTVVGGGPQTVLARLRETRQVRVAGSVPDVGPYYRDAHAVVVPVRAGGGTRIKILEAFSYGRPVVSTSVGVEGIAARGGSDILVADEPTDFAQRCASLMADAELRAMLAANAAALLNRAYTLAVLARTIDASCSPPARRQERSGAQPPVPR